MCSSIKACGRLYACRCLQARRSLQTFACRMSGFVVEVRGPSEWSVPAFCVSAGHWVSVSKLQNKDEDVETAHILPPSSCPECTGRRLPQRVLHLARAVQVCKASKAFGMEQRKTHEIILCVCACDRKAQTLLCIVCVYINSGM